MNPEVHFSYPLYEIHLTRALKLQRYIPESQNIFKSISNTLLSRLSLTLGPQPPSHSIRSCGPWPVFPAGTLPWNLSHPLEENSASAFLMFFVFQWVNNLPSLLSYLLQALTPGSPLLACFPGERFFPNIAKTLALAEMTHTSGLGNRFAPLLGLKEIAALTSRIGFKEVVTDKISFEFSFQSFYDFVRLNRALGQTRALEPSLPPLQRSVVRALKGPFQDGFDVIFLTGWRA